MEMDSQIAIETIAFEDADKIEEFLMQFFYNDSPISKSIKLSAKDGSERNHWQENCISDGQSFKAVTSTGEIIGVILSNFITKDDKHYDLETDHPKLKKLYDFINYMDNNVNVFEKYPTINKGLYINIVSVNEKYRNQRVARQLLNRTFDYMRQVNVSVCKILCTNFYLIRLCEQLDFKPLVEVPFRSYFVNGVTPILPEEPHRIAKILAKEL